MVSVIKRIFAPLDADFWAGVIMSTSLSPIPYPSDLHREHEQLPVARQPQFGGEFPRDLKQALADMEPQV